MDYDVVVIGAGLGGCAAAYHLRRAGWCVLLVERKVYPTHKLCGEYLSPDGVDSLVRMGLADWFGNGTLPEIGEVLVSSSSGRCWQAQLPAFGRGCSRALLDLMLVERCRAIGVQVVEGFQVREVDGNLEAGFYVDGTGSAGSRRFHARLVVGAFGKQGAFNRKLGRRKGGKTRRLMALKLHIDGGGLRNRVELHCFPGGYAGLCEVEGDRANLCLLTEVDRFQAVDCDCERFTWEVMGRNPFLRHRLEELKPNWNAVLAVANLSFGATSREAGGILMVGDAAASITPLCGDGMSMALRSAEILAPLADRFLARESTAASLVKAYEQKWQNEFRLRLRVGSLLQHVLLAPALTTGAALAFLNRFPALGKCLIGWTRGATSPGERSFTSA